MYSVFIAKLICIIYLLVMWYFLYVDKNLNLKDIDFSDCSDDYLFYQQYEFFEFFQEIRSNTLRKMAIENCIQVTSSIF